MILACANWIFGYAQRTECLLEEHWKFIKEDVVGAQLVTYDDTKWETVSVPHDWAIYGPFDRNNDLQNVTVVQNLEKKTSLKTGLMWEPAGIGLHSRLPKESIPPWSSTGQ